MFLTSLLTLSLLTVADALPRARSQNNTIKWGPCGFNGTLPIVCGNLSVPLDYTAPNSTARLSLSLIKVPAAHQPARGSILFSFGGPGGDGVHNLASIADVMQPMTGGYHDMISFDPRGTGNTLTFSCFDTALERTLLSLSLPSQLMNASDTALGGLWTAGKILSDTCQARLQGNASLVGTAFVARDMMQIVDALGEDGLLRYWGVSYGTVLGATAAAMFPDRMDRVILDGVENPHEYYHEFEHEMFQDTDSTFQGFLSGCLQNPDNCALARNNITLFELETSMDNLFKTLKYHPVQFNQTIIDYSVVKGSVFFKLYYPSQWPQLATLLDSLLTNNLTANADLWATVLSPEPGTTGESNNGIRCGDKFLRASNYSELTPWIEKNRSKRWFNDLGPSLMLTCAQWGMQAKERYDGDFNVKTRNPILFIGNSHDPVTPLMSARNASAGFEGSVVLHQNSYGHMSLAQPSNCTIEYIQKYLLNGTLPKEGTVCQPNHPLFYS